MNKNLRIVYAVFCSIALIVGFIGVIRYTYLFPTYTATILSVDDVRKMGNTNSFYRDYYEEDITVNYDDNKEGTVTIKERFKCQLPKEKDTVLVYQMKNGSLKERTSDTLIKYLAVFAMGIFGIAAAREGKGKPDV